MKTLPEFRLETYFSTWEFKAKYHMTASDAESLSMKELLGMATEQQREAFENLWLGYTETFGAPDLREEISRLYQTRSAQDILCFAGASEGIFAANTVLLDKDSHAIAITPNYQSHESLPSSICETDGVPLDPDDNWSLDIDRIVDVIRPNTRLITINFPHNPTGAMLPRDRLDALIELCRKHGIYILSDEIFNGLGRTGIEHMPHICDVYERGLSLNVMSKALGMPGLRIGWIACADSEVISQMERTKHYLSICNSAPSERLAKIGLENRDVILARNCELIDKNLIELTRFFERHENAFEWQPSDASCMAFPRYKGPGTVETFTRNLVEKSGVLLLPGSIYSSQLQPTPTDRFRIGFGRRNIAEGLAVMDQHMQDIP